MLPPLKLIEIVIILSCYLIVSNSIVVRVTNDGDDSSASGPFRTINRAWIARNSGDPVLAIEISRGTFILNQTLEFSFMLNGRCLLIGTEYDQGHQTILECDRPMSAFLFRQIGELYVYGITFRNCFNNGPDSGVIRADTVSRFNITNSRFENVGTSLGRGGAFQVWSFNDPCSVTIINSVFQNCSARTSGGAINIEHCNTIFDRVQISSSSSSLGAGGAIHWSNIRGESSGVTVTNSKFFQNRAFIRGGAMEIMNDLPFSTVTLIMRNTELYDNHVSGQDVSSGGAIVTERIGVTMDKVSIYNNTVDEIPGGSTTKGGGASFIFDIGSDVASIVDSTFYNNLGEIGGGIYVTNHVQPSNSSILAKRNLFSSCNFMENRASSGGAIAVSWATVQLHGCNLIQNAARSGGGIYSDKGNILLSRSIITRNSGTTRGSGIFCENEALFSLSESSLFRNTFENDVSCGILGCIWSGIPGNPCTDSCIRRDACSICDGNNSTCLSGCDNLPWSRSVLDSCGTCGGEDNSCTEPIDWKMIGIIIGSVVGFIVIVVGVVVAVVFIRRRRRNRYYASTIFTAPKKNTLRSHDLMARYSDQPPSPQLVTVDNNRDKERSESIPLTPVVTNRTLRTVPTPPPIMSSKHEINYKELVFLDKLGEGGFGEVYLGEYRMSKVAIKKIKAGSLSNSQLAEFRAEVRVMSSVKPHINIIQVLGASLANENELCLVTEYYPNGSLDNFLRSNEEITSDMIYRWVSGIAAAMYHLVQEGIVHRDLAARNILLDDTLRPKVADFGLARFGNHQQPSTTKTEFGPLKYMPPEALERLEYSEKSDVWSFGIVCWEIINRSEPYPEYDAYLASVKVLTEGLHPPLPSRDEYPVIADIMERCFSREPADRPTFSSICKQLNAIYPQQTIRPLPPRPANPEIVYMNAPN